MRSTRFNCNTRGMAQKYFKITFRLEVSVFALRENSSHISLSVRLFGSAVIEKAQLEYNTERIITKKHQ